MARRLAAALGLILLSVAPSARQTPAAPSTRPKLFVILIIDQFRADYAEMYGSQWTAGLRRLFDKGAVFTEARYPYFATFTCAGHATIGTGAYPAVHGMTGNDFYDRAMRRLVPCAFDPWSNSVPLAGATGTEHQSGRALLVPTFGEELRRQSAPGRTRVVSIAQKPRSAVTLAGKGSPDTIAIWEEDDGTWATSTMYATAPWPSADAFVREHPIKADYGKSWTLLRPPETYKYTDDAAGEGRPAPWSSTFPHDLTSRKGAPDLEFVNAWEKSPNDDAFLTDLAIHLLRTEQLGKGPGTDVLTLSLPCVDHNGHEFGPRSFEVQDVLARADIAIGRLLDALDAELPGNYVLGLSADHGVAVVPEQLVAEGVDAGRVSSTEVRTAVNAAVEKAIGVPNAYASLYDGQIALVPGAYDALRRVPGGINAVKAAIAGVRGMSAVYSADDVVTGSESDPLLAAWRLSYVAGRSGDFLPVPKMNWIIRGGTGTTHGTAYDYDRRVPLVFLGRAIRPGRYDAPASPADLVVTFATMAGITLPRAQGHSLSVAIAQDK